jgi:hypothetical protein
VSTLTVNLVDTSDECIGVVRYVESLKLPSSGVGRAAVDRFLKSSVLIQNEILVPEDEHFIALQEWFSYQRREDPSRVAFAIVTSGVEPEHRVFRRILYERFRTVLAWYSLYQHLGQIAEALYGGGDATDKSNAYALRCHLIETEP